MLYEAASLPLLHIAKAKRPLLRYGRALCTVKRPQYMYLYLYKHFCTYIACSVHFLAFPRQPMFAVVNTYLSLIFVVVPPKCVAVLVGFLS